MFFDKHSRMMRAFGFKSDQEGIISRHLRERGGWNPHLENTKKSILTAAQTKNKGTVYVLGSGWLLDVPIAELAAEFKHVVLVDIYHPRQITEKIKQWDNVTCIELDISGAVEVIYDSLKEKKQLAVNELVFSTSLQNLWNSNEPDFVVSVNLLNQLDILITDYLRNNTTLSKVDLQQLKIRIQQHHMNQLPAQRTCLITDYEELIYLQSGELDCSNKLVFVDVPKSEDVQYWQWQFDNSQTYYDNRKTVFNVVATNL